MKSRESAQFLAFDLPFARLRILPHILGDIMHDDSGDVAFDHLLHAILLPSSARIKCA